MNWHQLKQRPLSEIIEWAETQSWCAEMAACVQDPRWHSEGDVWTHTKLVCQQLTQLEQWPELTDHDRSVLVFTALFHDVAKPMTTQVDPDTGHVTSPKHAVKGEHVARGVLRDLQCDLATREQIARLVRFHGRPAFLGEREHPVNEVVQMSLLVENRMLYLFAIADTRGRDTESFDRPIEELHYWRLLSQEHECYRREYAFKNDHARYLFCQRRDADLSYVPFQEFSCDVTVMSGLPGSGKDTWLADNRDKTLPVVSLDGIRRELKVSPTDNQGKVVQLAKERCREHLRSGTSFVFNATNILRQTRQRWIGLFNDYKARVEIVYVEPPLKQILRQNKQRGDRVPEKVIRKLAAKIEPPTMTEAHDVIYCDGGIK